MNVLVIAAHPDDEVLGCGGTMARRDNAGDEVSVLFLGEGMLSRYKDKTDPEGIDKASDLMINMVNAQHILGTRNIKSESFPDNQFDTVPLLKIVKTIELVIEELKPMCIYTHHYSDLNIDHAITSRATLIATRPIGEYPVKTVMMYEVPSSTEWSFRNEFKPNVFVDITRTLKYKIAAMETYEGEIRKFPHPRSSKALRAIANRWGSVAGVEAAEAFELVRQVV